MEEIDATIDDVYLLLWDLNNEQTSNIKVLYHPNYRRIFQYLIIKKYVFMTHLGARPRSVCTTMQHTPATRPG